MTDASYQSAKHYTAYRWPTMSKYSDDYVARSPLPSVTPRHLHQPPCSLFLTISEETFTTDEMLYQIPQSSKRWFLIVHCPHSFKIACKNINLRLAPHFFFLHNTVYKTHFFKLPKIIFLSYYDTTLHSIQNNLDPQIFFFIKSTKLICKDTEWNTEGKGVPVQPPYTEKEGTFPNNVISITEKRGNSCHGKKTNFMQ